MVFHFLGCGEMGLFVMGGAGTEFSQRDEDHGGREWMRRGISAPRERCRVMGEEGGRSTGGVGL